MEDIRFVPDSHGAILTLNKHRKRLLYTINLICIIAFVPFGIRAFMHSHILLGISLLAFVVTLVINTICVVRRGHEFFHYSIVTSCLITALTLAVYHRGIGAIFWAFPVIVTSIFVLPKRSALFFSLVLTTAISILMFHEIAPGIAIRAAASLLFTITISYVVVSIIQDLQEKLRRGSEEDPLPGLSNRRQLDDKLVTALSKFHLSHTPAVILLIDIDRFKAVNDELGHDAGDRTIKIVAKAIEGHTRKTDNAFRLGGDEFLVLLNSMDWTEGRFVAERIRSDVEKLSGAEGFSVSVSIGASLASGAMDKSSWMKQADDAMYQAKMMGRNCFHLYTHPKVETGSEATAQDNP